MNPYVYTAVCGTRDRKRTDIPCHGEYSKFREPVLNAKIYKVLPHLFFKDYDVFMWVDANIFLNYDVEYYCAKYLKDADIALIRHPFRKSITEEAAELRKKDYYHKIPELEEQVETYFETDFNDDLLFECNVIIRRNTERVNSLFERWWAHITRWQYRDQISMPFVIKQFGDIKLNIIHPSARTNNDFMYKKHVKATPLVSIIMVTYGKWPMTKTCLDSLFASKIKQDVEVIVVDNGSTDETIEELRKYPGIKMFINPMGSHFSKGCNTGCQHATGEYFLFLNNDTIIESDFITPMLENFKDQSIGIVGAKCLYPDRTVQHCGIVVKENYNIKHIFQTYPDEAPETNIKRKYQCVTAACMMIRSHVFKELNGFDENFRTGWEDIDLCLRAGKAGYLIQYEPAARIVHIGHQSEGRGRYNKENKELYRTKWVNRVKPDMANVVRYAEKVKVEELCR